MYGLEFYRFHKSQALSHCLVCGDCCKTKWILVKVVCCPKRGENHTLGRGTRGYGHLLAEGVVELKYFVVVCWTRGASCASMLKKSSSVAASQLMMFL